MADIQINKPSDPTGHSSSSDSKDPDKPSKKRKNLQIHDHQTGDDHHSLPPSKRPQNDKQPAKETEEEEDDDIEDTATSNPKKKEQQDDEDDVEGFKITDFAVLMSITRFHRDNGVYPFETSSTMQKFLDSWACLGLATSKQLKARIEGVKNKYNGGAEGVAKHGNEVEFKTWKKINWGKKASGGGDDDKDKGGCS
ncbi:hypothetical protein OSB04_015381 [Centaurea solstitialis]|uniref:Uncharacterized protein n=1 Tax=Centaurea solstitialis TaxID=347529 RepID=A0AA38TA27_9ASTR|nr:hypothetical protein OSB04_015381 [Centaurea solstitialis]